MAHRATTRTGALALGAMLLALGSAPLSASAATTTAIDFSSSGYTVGFHSPAAQNGWWMAKNADFSLVDNSSFPESGLPSTGRSLQFSNSTQPSGGAHLISPAIDAAGESTTGADANTFETTFTVASATGAAQPGLGVDVALDGASRFGGVVNLRHSADSLEIGSYWYPTGAADGSVESWRSAVFTRVDPSVPHVIRAVAVFLDGKPDTFDVYVDGTLVSSGSGASTWEAYSGSDGDRSVDSISFKASSSAPTANGIGYQFGLPVAAATAGKGLLFSGISYGVSTTTPIVPSPEPTTPPAPQKPAPAAPPPAPTPSATAEPVAPLTITEVSERFGADTAALLETYLRETGRDVPPSLDELFTAEGEIDLSDFSAWLSWTGDETVKLYGYSSPTYLGTFPVVNGQAQISGVDLTSLGEGAHHLLIVGEQSGAFQVAGLEVAAPPQQEAAPALPTPTAPAETGLSPWLMAGIAALLLAALVVTAVLVRRRFA